MEIFPNRHKLIFCLLLFHSGVSVLIANLQAPRFNTPATSSNSIVTEGRTKILQCQAVGLPQPEYQWIKDGQILSEYSSDTFYKIQNISKTDAGNYSCLAKNSVGTIVSSTISIIVAYLSKFIQNDSSLNIKSGDYAILEMPSLDCVPPPSVSWIADNESKLYGIKYAITTNKNLVILSVDRTDQKSYQARATNTQLGLEENSPYIHLTVDGYDDEDVSPEIVIPPQDVTATVDTEFVDMECIANARPLYQLELYWLKDDVPILEANVAFNFKDLWNRTLSLQDISSSHQGNYTCVVQMKTGGPSLSKTARLSVIKKPFFVTKMHSEIPGNFGSTLSLKCHVDGIPKPNIHWIRNGFSLTEATKYHVDEDGTLTIDSMHLEDSGMFQCSASNIAGTVNGYTWLRVQTSSPVFIEPPNNMTAIDGKDITFSCSVSGAPVPNITWSFNGKPISQTGRHSFLETGGIFITNVRAIDRGKYTCEASNEAGSLTGDAWLTILLRTQIVKPPVDSKVILGHVASLYCKVSSDVLYNISWYHDNSVIHAENSARINIEDGTLTIAEARASDGGSYRCKITSLGGNDERSAHLDVIELPYAPTRVTAERLSTSLRSINVSWTPGFDGNSPIIKFIIQFHVVPNFGILPKDDYLHWKTALANISSTSRFVVLNTLRSSASYVFRVSAVNSVGEGPPSSPSTRIILPQEPPSGPPMGLVGSARSESEIMIQWQPVLEDEQNGDILGYIVRYRLFGYNESPWSYRNVSKASQRTYLITELITWKDYEIQMAAYNNEGPGSYSSSIRLKTREGVPDSAPSQLRVEALDSFSIKVWWKPPDPQKINGINQGYKLEAWNSESVEVPVSTHSVQPDLLNPLSEQSASLKGLKPWTKYNITVLCFTSPGDGKKSEPETVQTLPYYPGPILGLKFEDITDRGLRVLWNEPQDVNGILLGYTLRYMVKEEIHTMVERNFTKVTKNYLLNSLKPTTHYTFEVYAFNQVGKGEISTATIQSGVEPTVPNPPFRLAVSDIRPFSVYLQFTPGFDGNSSIIKWSIQALSARNASWTTIYEISDPEAKAIEVKNLLPYNEYILRIIAQNVAGSSSPSEPSRQFQTIQAPPSHPPQNVTIRSISSTELRLRWIPLSLSEWYGIPRGYNISYRILGNVSPLHSISIEDPSRNSFLLENLEEFTKYEVVLCAYNDLGTSVPSSPVLAMTKESVPSIGPTDVTAEASSSTTILVKWAQVPKIHANGILEGYKVYYGAKDVEFRYKSLNSNESFQITLTELRKYTEYSIQVLSYTRMGNGALSIPPVIVQTFEDVPGPPSNVSFPDVSQDMARIIWDAPSEPNGIIREYRLVYYPAKNSNQSQTKTFLPTDRTYTALHLEPLSNYNFELSARTSLGWGYSTNELVYTNDNRDRPQAPSTPIISSSSVQARELSFNWNPGNDGYAPLRYYNVEYSQNGNGWKLLSERLAPILTSFTVSYLIPFTTYKFRIQAVNDIGPSPWSEESNSTKTLPAAPSLSIADLKATPISRTSIKLNWMPLEAEDFNGDFKSGGYIIEYKELNNFPSSSRPLQVKVHGYKKRRVILQDLLIGKNYEIFIVPFNEQGHGPRSSPVSVYVGEAVPTGSPQNISASSPSPTEVRLNWSPPNTETQNGDLLGYKIFYQGVKSLNSEEIDVVSASHTSYSLISLEMYTNYSISILAFNPAGDGPRSDFVFVQTLQGIPGPPSNLTFSEITMNTLKVSWDDPSKPNGEINGYLVAYETAKLDENYSKQVKQRVTDRFLFIHNLEEQVTYTFNVRAQTLDYGPPVYENVTTGPQIGSPDRPRDLVLSKTMSAVKLSWTNSNSGSGPILGYYIESRRKDEDKWKTESKTEGGSIQEYTISYQNLVPSTSYLFRIVAYNKFGISYPAKSSEVITTPSKRYLEYDYLQRKPFYREPWFLVALASSSIVIIIMVIAILCVKSKTYKYKDQAKQQRLGESSSVDEAGYSTFELRQSRRGTLSSKRSATLKSSASKNSKNSKSNTFAMINGARAPPRPTPSNVIYSDEEEDSAKGYDENPDDSDSLTEKPSEISSSDSQGGTESEQESAQSSDPHSFVNHYANVNNTFRQSWKKQKTIATAIGHPVNSRGGLSAVAEGPRGEASSGPPRGYSSFTESDQDGSSAVVSLNGTQIVLNNMARSRAPLPGFSSFV